MHLNCIVKFDKVLVRWAPEPAQKTQFRCGTADQDFDNGGSSVLSPIILTMQNYCKFVPATLDAAKTGFLAAIAEGKSKIDGVQLAEFVADKILEWRRI